MSDLAPGAVCAVHPERSARLVCTRCGSYGCEECAFSLVPGKEICWTCASDGLTEPLPWERRKEIGWWSAYWRTTKLVMLEPTRTFRTPSTEAGITGSIVYGALAYTIGQMIVLLLVLAMFLVMGVAVAATAEEPAIGAVFAGYGLCLVPFTLLQAPVYALIGILMSGSFAHLTLVVLKQATAKFDQSLRAVAYANAPDLLALFSCVAPFWVIAAETIALREIHRCSTGTALLATIGWRLAFVMLIAGGYAALIALVFALEQR
jgi:hypothetical protein